MFNKETDYSNQDLVNLLYYLDDNYSDFTVLHSNYQTSYSGDKTVLAFGLVKELSSLSALSHRVRAKNQFKLFGYFTYEAFNKASNNQINLLKFQEYKNHIIIDHKNNKLNFVLENDSIFNQINNHKAKPNHNKTQICSSHSSNMTDEDFKSYVTEIKKDISYGEYYQLNLTRKFFGKTAKNTDKIGIFLNLTQEFPAPYSALIRHQDKYIISSSPERFIKIENNKIQSRPIKGTLAKTKSSNKELLYNSIKDRAENLMIIDLMRNDLSPSSILGSVKTGKLFEIDEFANLYHMSTNVMSKKLDNISNIEVIKNAFPPASMTGAPKKAVTDRILEIEKLPRGVYSGAIGYFTDQEYCDFNVVIRTIIFDKDSYEYQVGGGITYDSDPELELQETNIKSAKIRKVLGISDN
ncbi:MAG: anthranilate synthase component I family protein [Rickettsiales bacterium]|nr:anthranilate synthase component I family protein [Rickettsiales bacterium]